MDLTTKYKRSKRAVHISLLLSALIGHPTFVAAQATEHPAPLLGSDIPADVAIPSNFPPGKNPIAFFDDFSWRSFVALCWPAASDVRGVPDASKRLGDLSVPAVWDTWKRDSETFQKNGVPPTEWSSFDALSADPSVAWSGGGLIRAFDGWKDVGSNSTHISHYNQAGFGTPKGTLVSQNQQYVRYEIAFNRTEFDFIRDRKLYLGSALDNAVKADGHLLFPFGSIELKIAWYVFGDEEVKDANFLAKFYVRDASLETPQGARETRRVGMIAMHIVSRTPSRPEWIWTSFEHVDLLEGSTPRLRDPSVGTNENRLEEVVDAAHPPKLKPTRTQVRRLRSLNDSTKVTNRLFREAVKGTVWENYQLVLTQWPTEPASDRNELLTRFNQGKYPISAPFPSESPSASNFANAAMETDGLFQNSVSCMRCHFIAAKQNKTEFVWVVGLRAFRPQPQEAGMRALLNDAARSFERTLLNE